MSFFSESLMIKILSSLIILSTTSYSAQAKPISQEKKEVLKQASNFAQAVACSTTFDNDAEYKTTSKNVFLVKSDSTYNTYFVLWSGDWGCLGGSATYSSFLTSFSRSADYRPFLIDQQDIFDNINADDYLINTRFIEDVKYDNDKLIIIGANFSDEGDDGGNNFPANRYKYTLALDKNSEDYKWKLINKKFMGKTNDAIKIN